MLTKIPTTLAILIICAFGVACTTTNSGEVNETTDYENAVVTLQRTACYGFCPIYTVTIYGDGRVEYNGDDFVEVTGEQTAKIEPQAVRELVDFMLSSGYAEFEDEYTEFEVTDMPSSNTSLEVNGQLKQVQHYYGDQSAPSALREIEDRIDTVANTAQWIDAP